MELAASEVSEFPIIIEHRVSECNEGDRYTPNKGMKGQRENTAWR